MALEHGLIAMAIAVSGLSLTAAWVHARHVRPSHVQRGGTATLLMALTGEAQGLERLIRALDRQTLPPRRLIAAVESTADPAFAAIERLIDAPTSFAVETVIAGTSVDTAQKCMNLIAAARHIDDDDDVIVLLDGDVVPPQWWLSALVSPLQGGRCDIVTGYRWPVIEAHALGAHIIAAIDRTIAVLPRPRQAAVVWGGSLAMTHRAFRTLDLEHRLASTLSDDLTIGTVAAKSGLRVLTRRSLLVPSPEIRNFFSAWSFGRRQYQMMRLYRPKLWTLALVIMAVQCAAWGMILWHVTTSRASSAAWMMLLSLAVIKLWQLARIGRRLGFPDSTTVCIVQLGLAIAKPLIDAVHLGVILAAARPRTVTWGHITYRVADPSHITVRDRKPWCGSSA